MRILVPSLMILLVCTGCVSSQKYTQAQLNAIETREVDASLEETFSAAASALFDAGYTIAMSDRLAGLITGKKSRSQAAARLLISYAIEDTHFSVSIQVREVSPERCTTRIKTAVNGEPRVKKEAIDEIWVLMQRQVLMKAPPSLPDG